VAVAFGVVGVVMGVAVLMGAFGVVADSYCADAASEIVVENVGAWWRVVSVAVRMFAAFAVFADVAAVAQRVLVFPPPYPFVFPVVLNA